MSYKDPQVLYIQVSQLDGLLRGIEGILEQSYPRDSDYWTAVDRYEELRIEREQLYDEYKESLRNQTKLFEELCVKLTKPIKPRIVEQLNVTTSSIIIDENTFGDDSDVQDAQINDEELVRHQIDVPIHEIHVDDMKIVNKDINDNSLLEDVKESFRTTHIDFIIPHWFYEGKHINDISEWLPKVPDQQVWSPVRGLWILHHYKTRGRVFFKGEENDAEQGISKLICIYYILLFRNKINYS